MKMRIILMLCVLASASTALAASQRVDNSSSPSQGTITATLTEQWRAGGEDDDIFFGNIAASRVDAAGNVLLLDSQLSHVLVISPTGELVTTIGQEGDGPGEIRGAGDMILAADGTVYILQGFPGRVVKIHPDGTPAGEASYATSDGSGGKFVVLVRGMPYPEGMVLAGISMSFAGGGTSIQNYFLSICNSEGVQQTELLTKQSTIDYSEFVMSEMGLDFIWSRTATSNNGTVYAAPARDKYLIQAYTQGQEPSLVFTRPVSVPNRTSEQKALAHKVLEGVAANYPVPPKRYIVEEKPAVISGMWTTDDGLLWVQTNPGIDSPPDGCWATLDVFNAEGQYLRQVAIPGDFNPQQDSLSVLRDGRLLVTVGALEAFLNQQAVGSDDNNESEADPLEIICYDLNLK